MKKVQGNFPRSRSVTESMSQSVSQSVSDERKYVLYYKIYNADVLHNI